jgi:uncharacterized membrane protein YcaP (DUF421 family)
MTAMRLMGKRQLGELEASEFVVTLIISDIASVAMQDTGIPLLHGLIPIFVLMSLEFIFVFICLKSLKFRKLACGKPCILLENGRVIRKELTRSRFSIDELMEELRGLNVTDLGSLKYVILETSGKISVIPFADRLPATPSDFGQKPVEKGLPILIINDGRLLEQNANIRNVDRQWVEDYLRTNGRLLIKNILIMTIDDAGGIYIQEKE